jgi:hypothetical protein
MTHAHTHTDGIQKVSDLRTGMTFWTEDARRGTAPHEVLEVEVPRACPGNLHVTLTAAGSKLHRQRWCISSEARAYGYNPSDRQSQSSPTETPEEVKTFLATLANSTRLSRTAREALKAGTGKKPKRN